MLTRRTLLYLLFRSTKHSHNKQFSPELYAKKCLFSRQNVSKVSVFFCKFKDSRMIREIKFQFQFLYTQHMNKHDICNDYSNKSIKNVI